MTNTKHRTFSLTEKASEYLDDLFIHFEKKGLKMSRSYIISRLIVSYREKILGDNHHEKKEKAEVFE